MEQIFEFNGVKILLTTGERLSEVQNFADYADVIISVYQDRLQILKAPFGMLIGNYVKY